MVQMFPEGSVYQRALVTGRNMQIPLNQANNRPLVTVLIPFSQSKEIFPYLYIFFLSSHCQLYKQW